MRILATLQEPDEGSIRPPARARRGGRRPAALGMAPRAGQHNAEQKRAGEEVPSQVPGIAKGEVLDQLLVSDDVATDLLPYQVEEDTRLSQGRGPRFLTYLTLPCIMLLCILGFEFISDARGVKLWRSTRT